MWRTTHGRAIPIGFTVRTQAAYTRWFDLARTNASGSCRTIPSGAPFNVLSNRCSVRPALIARNDADKWNGSANQ